jgi:hypothetical protein
MTNPISIANADTGVLNVSAAGPDNRRTLGRKDLVVGSVIALLMAAIFSALGGRPLIVTFVPVLAVVWLIFLRMYVKKMPLPQAADFLPIYFSLLAWQFMHFAEEYLTGFYSRFPSLYGAEPFSPELFVSFNMVSYALFVVACLLVFSKNLKFLLIPVLFFVAYGAIGNAISHTWWVILQKSYFPGFYTALAYWIIGPLALAKLIGSRNHAFAWTAVIAVALVPIMTVFIQRN